MAAGDAMGIAEAWKGTTATLVEIVQGAHLQTPRTQAQATSARIIPSKLEDSIQKLLSTG